MTEKRIVIILWAVSLLVFSAGVVLSVKTYSACSQGRARFERKLREHGELMALERRMAGYDAAVASFERLENKEIPALKTIIQERFPDCNPDEIRESRKDGAGAWIINDIEAALSDVVLSGVMGLVVEAEQMRPPWVLKKCVLTASSRIENHGNVVLTFTGLTRR